MSADLKTPPKSAGAGSKRSASPVREALVRHSPKLVERLEKAEESSPAARALLIRAVNNLISRVAASPGEAESVLDALRSDYETCKVLRTFPRDEDDILAARRDEGIQSSPLALAIELRVSSVFEFLLDLDSTGGVDSLTRKCPNGLTPLDYTFAEGADPDIRLRVLRALREPVDAGRDKPAKRAKIDEEE